MVPREQLRGRLFDMETVFEAGGISPEQQGPVWDAQEGQLTRSKTCKWGTGPSSLAQRLAGANLSLSLMGKAGCVYTAVQERPATLALAMGQAGQGMQH